MASASPGLSEVDRLQGLYRDLLHLNESKLSNIDRLVSELEAHIADFRKLLDKTGRNDKSRQALSSGSIEIEGTTYSVNEEFKQETLQLAEVLDLDELEAARIYMIGEQDARTLDRSPLASAVIVFHQRRLFSIECLRMILQLGAQTEHNAENDQSTSVLGEAVGLIVLQSETGAAVSGSLFWRKCLSALSDIEQWLQNVADRMQSMSVTGQIPSDEFTEVMSMQHQSLTRQHESLAAVICHLIDANHTKMQDFELLINRLKIMDRYDVLMVHYVPALICLTRQQAPSADNLTYNDSQKVQDMIITHREHESWALRNLQAATKVIWLAQYSARFDDDSGRNLDTAGDQETPEKRSAAFMEALRDGAFEFLLSIGRDVKDDAWFDPLRHGITSFLTQDTPALVTDPFRTEKFFHDLLTQQLQVVVQSCITHMPDTLRQLRADEDEQRRQFHGAVSSRSAEQELHLERFLIVVAYAYEGFPDAAQNFWHDHEGNLFGFLQWASQRQSTPRVAAFCEMLCALSEDELCATSAHNFLLGEGSVMGGRSRRSSPLAWTHIFGELEFYSSSIREKPVLQANKPQTELVEPESGMMLECYLRLLRHLSRQSSKARAWLIISESFRVHEHLFLLCSSSTASRLRGCAFSALAALLTNKERAFRDVLWTNLDAWISGGSTVSSNMLRPPQSHSSALINEQLIFESLSNGFEEPNAFVCLIQALVTPINSDADLNDSLPFPETLGAAYRMPGIEPYVDFVLGRVFASKSFELQDPIQLRIMRCNCLSFAESCLLSFNESLVVFASRSNISVDSAIRTSSLATYARLHPFARVMEWFFNDSVITALFATTEQELKDVNESAAGSPLILGLIRSIRIIDLILMLQSTYFEIVRPIVKLQSVSRRPTVANSALATFEDAILNHIGIVTRLGLYCGSGHEELAVASIRLLHKLCSSSKLSAPLNAADRRILQKSRLLVAMEMHNDSESISRSLIALMRFDEAEIEQGGESPGMVIKTLLLRFLHEGVAVLVDRPTIAHLLLGFTCHTTSLDVPASSLFATGESLFHAIVNFMRDSPHAGPGTMLSWLSSIRNEGMQLLSKLWKSPISTRFILPELRHSDFLFAQWLQQPVISRKTLWDNQTVEDSEFFISTSATGYIKFLEHRCAFFDYAATELKSAANSGLTTLRNRIQSASLGLMSFPDGQQIQCPTLFDFADFLRFELGEMLQLPDSNYYSNLDFNVCRIQTSAAIGYDVPSAEQLLLLRQNELRQAGQLPAATDDSQAQADAENILQCFIANNNRSQISIANTATLEAWFKLLLVFLECAEMEVVQRNSFILQSVQLLLPHFEKSLSENTAVSLLLAQLARGLVDRFNYETASSTDIIQDPANDRLFQLFRLGLIGIQYPNTSASLREICYMLCHRYLSSIIALPAHASTLKLALHAIKALGDRLVEVICDDAYAAEAVCRTAALLILGSIVAASNQQAVQGVVESMSRLNFIRVMVDSIRAIPSDLQQTSNPSALLPIYNASLALLLRISQTRPGAAHVVSAGIFGTIRDSGLFTADPDIGLDVGNPQALTAYFKLILAILRIINAVVLSRGSQNDQTISEAHNFLREYRMNIMAVFKRSAQIGIAGDVSRASEENEGLLQELVDNFTLLITASEFLATEQQHDLPTPSTRLFT